MATWSDLDRELALWQQSGKRPTFWWRDDDAHEATPALEPMLALAETYGAPVHLAVIPAKLQPCLAARLAQGREVLTMQHGYAHKNHQPKGGGASEFGEQRTLEAIRRELADGWRILSDAGLPNLVHAFVPPWNRMSAAAVRCLHDGGYEAISAYAGYAPDLGLPGLLRIDGHIDPIRWKYGNVFRGEASMLEMITDHLAARREGRVDVDMPTGYLTHHLDTGPEIWDFTKTFFDNLARDNRAEWLRLPSLIAAQAGSADI